MSEIEEIVQWCFAAYVQYRAKNGEVLAFPLLAHKHVLTCGFLAVPARISMERDDEGEACWQLHPNPERASKKSWVWLVMVKDGYSARMLDRFHPGPVFEAWLRDCAALPHLRAFMNAVHGPEKLDLVAVSPDLKKHYGTMMKIADVLGDPQYPECTELPVRVFRDIPAWLEGDCNGVVLLGNERQNTDWLRRCDGGIVFDDIKQAEFWQKRLRRPYDGPKVLVAAA